MNHLTLYLSCLSIPYLVKVSRVKKYIMSKAIKNLAVFYVVGLSQDPKVEGQSSIKSRLRRFSKSPENGFFDPEYGQNDPLRGPNFDQNFDFRGHI